MNIVGFVFITEHPIQPLMTFDLSVPYPKLKEVDLVLPLPDQEDQEDHYIIVNTTKKRKEEEIIKLGVKQRAMSSLCRKQHEITGFILLPPEEMLIVEQNGTISKIQVKDGKTVEEYKMDVGGLMNGVSLGNNELLLVDFKRGHIFTYDMERKHKEIRVKKLNKPSSVAAFKSEGETLYAVCERGGNCVKVYDSNWQMKTSIGKKGRIFRRSGDGQLNSPTSAVVLPGNTVLVSDFNNNRVTEFTLQGEFIRHVITGIEQPLRLVFDYPNLWVSYGFDKPNIKCYQLFS